MSRLASLPGFQPTPPRGMWTKDQRFYFVTSLAIQEHPDRARAIRLYERMLARRKIAAPEWLAEYRRNHPATP